MRTELNREERAWLERNSEYINQDNVQRAWRERLEQEIASQDVQANRGELTIADLIENASQFGELSTWLEENFSPLEYLCIMLFYNEGRSYAEISEMLTSCINVEGQEFFSEHVTIKKIGNTLAKVRGNIKRKFLLTRDESSERREVEKTAVEQV